MDIFKNPVLIGLVCGTITYVYLTNDVNEKNRINQKRKKNKNRKPEEVNLLIPLVVALIAWFLVYSYFEYNDNKIKNVNNFTNQQNRSQLPLPLQLTPNHFIGDQISAQNTQNTPELFSLVNTGTGINIPRYLPDVMIEVK
jgi:hypothetical protein